MQRPIITLTSDFGVQSQGVGNMEGVILSIAPDANVIHLMHGLPDFDIRSGAPLIMVDDYGRVEVALNQGSFVATYGIRVGDWCRIV